MKRYKNTIWAVALLAVMASCSEQKKQTAVVEEKPQVRLETVNVQPVAQTQEFTATVDADVVNNISPSVVLRIDKILVEVGDRVQAGQLLARVDRSNLHISPRPNSTISNSNTTVSWRSTKWVVPPSNFSTPSRYSSTWPARPMTT